MICLWLKENNQFLCCLALLWPFLKALSLMYTERMWGFWALHPVFQKAWPWTCRALWWLQGCLGMLVGLEWTFSFAVRCRGYLANGTAKKTKNVPSEWGGKLENLVEFPFLKVLLILPLKFWHYFPKWSQWPGQKSCIQEWQLEKWVM